MTFNGLGNYQRMLSDSTFKKPLAIRFILISPSSDHALFGADRIEHIE